jgi:hypothetical protein
MIDLGLGQKLSRCVYTDIRYPPRTSKQQLTIGKMVKDRAKKEKSAACNMQKQIAADI